MLRYRSKSDNLFKEDYKWSRHDRRTAIRNHIAEMKSLRQYGTTIFHLLF